MIRPFLVARRSTLLALVVACAGEPTPPHSAVQPSHLLIWRDTMARGESVPVFDSAAVYFLEQQKHIVSAVDRNTGVLLWRRILQTSKPEFDGYGLTIAGGVLVVGDLDVFGLDRTTGATLWKFDPTEGLYPGFNSLTSDGTTVYCGSTTGHVYAVDGATGTQIWVTSFNPLYTQVWAPQLVDGVVYVGFSQIFTTIALGGAAALDAKSGQLLWRTLTPRTNGEEWSTYNDYGVAVTPSLVVLGSLRSVYGLNRITGKVTITVDPSVLGDAGATAKPLHYTGSVVVAGNGAPGTLTALDPKDLHKVWQAPGDGGITAMGSDDLRTYVARPGAFDVYRTSDGVRLWRLTGADIGAPNEVYLAAPGIDATHLYLAGSKAVYAFKKE